MARDAWATLPQPVSGVLPNTLEVAAVPDPTLAFVVTVSRVLAARAEDALLPGTEQRGVWPALRDFSTVRRFRRKHLPEDQLLTTEQVEGWVHEQAARDGEPSWWFTEAWVHPEDILRREEDGMILKADCKVHYEPMIAWARQPDPEHPYTGVLEHRVVEYATPTAPHREQPVRAEGCLDALRLLTVSLRHEYAWTPAQGAVYVLTGLAPIADIFARRLIEQQGRRPKAMSHKHLQLAAFTAEHLGEPLALRMAAWNERYPDWTYNTVTHFGGDSALAMKRAGGSNDKR